jgi:hypothetical protein
MVAITARMRKQRSGEVPLPETGVIRGKSRGHPDNPIVELQHTPTESSVKDPLEVSLVQYNHVVEALATEAPGGLSGGVTARTAFAGVRDRNRTRAP